MNRTTTVAIAILGGALLLAGCGSSPTPLTFTSATASVVLPVSSDPIVNTATAPTLSITYAAAENNIDPVTNKNIADRLELTLKNTGTTPLTGFEVYYTMTDTKTGKSEAYYEKLSGMVLAAGQASTVYFDNKTDPGHYPENAFSIYRTSNNQVDFAIQVSATGSKIATATATKSPGTGEKVD